MTKNGPGWPVLGLVALAIILMSVSCAQAGSQASTPTPQYGATETVVAQALEARITARAPAQTPSPTLADLKATQGPRPTATPASQVSPTAVPLPLVAFGRTGQDQAMNLVLYDLAGSTEGELLTHFAEPNTSTTSPGPWMASGSPLSVRTISS